MRSPGHQKWPDYKLHEQRSPRHVMVRVNGEVIADSRDVIVVMEDEHPQRYYFSRRDVKMDKLERSATTSKCIFKGEAHYYNVRCNGECLVDAVWTYEDPYEEHRDLKDRVAFWDERAPGICILPRA